MKITIVQGAFFPVPPLLGGAVEQIWSELGERFAELGHEVTHISRCFPELSNHDEQGLLTHIRVKGYNQPRSILRLKYCDLLYSLRALRNLPPADLVVTHTFWLPVFLRRKKFGAVYVHQARMPKGQLFLYRHVARLQAVSSPLADAMLSELPDCDDKIKVIPYPLSCEAFPVEIKPYAQREKIILYAGRIHPEKGLHILLDAFIRFYNKTHGDWKLVIAGSWEFQHGGGGEKYFHSLKNLMPSGFTSITWTGPFFGAEKKELYGLYQSARIFVYPSLAEKGETFGVAPLEAMASGCVPIVSDLPCFQDFIVDGENGCVFNHCVADPMKELFDKLVEVASSNKSEELSLKARKTADNYNMETVSEKYLEDFRMLCPHFDKE